MSRSVGIVAERGLVQARGFLGDLEDADALDVARRAGEVLVDERLLQADRFEDLRAAVGLVRGDAHLGHHLVESLADRLDEALVRLLVVDAGHRFGELRERLEREIRMDRFGAVSCEEREVVHLARRAGLDHEARRRAQARLHEMLVDGGRREQRRNGKQRGRHAAIRQDDDVVALRDRVLRVRREARERGFHAVRAPFRGIADVELERPERAAREQLDVPDLLHVVRREDGLLRFEAHRRLGDVRFVVDREEIRPRPDERHERHHELLADRIDRRVRDLREELLEVVVEDLRAIGQHRQRGVVAHRAQRFLAGLEHRSEQDLDVLLRVAERLLAIEHRHFGRIRRGGLRHVLEAQAAVAHPFPVRLLVASVRFSSSSSTMRPSPCRRAASCPAAGATS
jgi:hypothetical protein